MSSDTAADTDGLAKDTRPDPAALAISAARCFQGADGHRLLGYMRAITVERALGPGVSDTQLRHLEGQRQFVKHIETLIERGRNGPTSAQHSPSTDQ